MHNNERTTNHDISTSTGRSRWKIACISTVIALYYTMFISFTCILTLTSTASASATSTALIETASYATATHLISLVPLNACYHPMSVSYDSTSDRVWYSCVSDSFSGGVYTLPSYDRYLSRIMDFSRTSACSSTSSSIMSSHLENILEGNVQRIITTNKCDGVVIPHQKLHRAYVLCEEEQKIAIIPTPNNAYQ